MSSTPITWFEIGADRPDEAERFYGELFGWAFEEQGGPGRPYRVTAAGGETEIGGAAGIGGEAGIGGAIRGLEDGTPNYAIFYAQVADVAEACRRAEAAGGTVLVPLRSAPSGLTYAQLADPVGNRLGVFTPPPAS